MSKVNYKVDKHKDKNIRKAFEDEETLKEIPLSEALPLQNLSSLMQNDVYACFEQVFEKMNIDNGDLINSIDQQNQ